MMTTGNFSKLTAQIIFLITIAISIYGCTVSQSVDLSKSITREECEADKSFVFIPPGEFILGSDRQEQDFAYLISAQAIARTEKGIAQAEQKLRQTGWFERETPRQTSFLPGFCRAAYQHPRPLKSRHILFGFRLVQE